MNNFEYFIITTLIPILLLFVSGGWLYRKSGTAEKHKKTMKAIGIILISIGIICCLIGVAYFSIINSECVITLNASMYRNYNENLYDENRIMDSEVVFLVDGLEYDNYAFMGGIYAGYWNLEEDFYLEMYYVKNSSYIPYNFIDNSNNATISINKQGNKINISIINSVTSELYSYHNYELLKEATNQNIKVIGVDGEIEIDIRLRG